MNTFEKLYAENYKTIFCVAKKMVNDRDAVSDIVQEVFIYLFNRLNKGHVIHHPQSWLYKATYNKCIDYFRQQKNFQSIESIKDNIIAGDQKEETDIKATINFALSKLKPQEKLLAVLYSEGLSYKEIAEVTDIKFSSIGKMLSRTLKKLEDELKNQKYELY